VLEDAMQSDALVSAVGKAKRRLIPFIMLMYVLAFLDRANIGFAKNVYQLDTGIGDAVFALGAGIFFVGYALFEVPSNLLMHRYGARFWMFRIMFTWGLLSAGFAFAYNETIFLTLRFLLGIAEAGFFPGIVYYMTYWFPGRYRMQVMGMFYFGVPLAYVLGSPLSGFLLEYMHSFLGLHGWQWMFLIEGGLATLVSFGCLAYLQNGPKDERCTWLNREEKDAIASALEEEQQGKPSHNILASLTSPKVLYLCAIYGCIQIGVYGMIFYLPTQVAALLGSQVGLKVGLVAAIPWLCTMVGLYYIPRRSDGTGDRVRLPSLCLALAGLGLICSGLFSSPVLAIAGLCVAATGFFSAQGCFWILPTMYLSGVAAASGIAFINSIGNLGGFIAPNLRVWVEQATASTSGGLIALGIAALIGSAFWFRITLPHQEEKHT
jgi:Sugar phosphate permease